MKEYIITYERGGKNKIVSRKAEDAVGAADKFFNCQGYTVRTKQIDADTRGQTWALVGVYNGSEWICTAMIEAGPGAGYYVIGGQYFLVNYGQCKTLAAAKLLAARNAEYWDNLQDWHTPKIYRAEDCMKTASGDIVPMPERPTLAYYSNKLHQWIPADEWRV